MRVQVSPRALKNFLWIGILYSMKTQVSFIPYQKTNKFSSLVNDYLAHSPKLQPYYNYTVNFEGIKQAITQRKQFPFHRHTLVKTLLQQYADIACNEITLSQIHSLEKENTFTVCTAHQPNLFGGHLYTMYKTIHAIQLANDLKKQFPEYHFVPVYYIGSEDADKAELLHLYCKQQKIEFNTSQTGAVGRMQAEDLDSVFEEIKTILKDEPFTTEIVDILKKCYAPENTFTQGIKNLLHHLFADKGLVIVDGDDRELKKCFVPLFEKELYTQFSENLLQQTIPFFSENYFIPTQGRNINLFYLEQNIRERIVQEKGQFYYVHQQKKTMLDIEDILKNNPEKLSPNVILRPLYQETILPNIAFIGGGGEVAYWLLLKKIFETAEVHYPVVILRNSLMMVTEQEKQTLSPYTDNEEDFFKGYDTLIDKYIANQKTIPDFQSQTLALQQIYQQLAQQYPSQNGYITLLEKHSTKGISKLEKKVWRGYRKKYKNEKLQSTLHHLFPHHNLQERIDSMIEWYAHYGKEIVDIWITQSHSLKQEFTIIYLEK